LNELPQISDSEWEVMKVLWARGSATARELVEDLKPDVDWHSRTIKTFLNRLVKKGAVGYRDKGRAYKYYPLASQQECRFEETRSFLEKVYDGAVQLMLAQFLKEEKLSPEEIEELKRILDSREE